MCFRVSLLAIALGLHGCAETDRTQYVEGETGTTTFSNPVSPPGDVVYLDGCNRFEQQQLVGEEWIERGGEHHCPDPGLAHLVDPMTSVSELFTAREEGRWRLVYTYGIRCSDAAPLAPEHCMAMRTATSEFEVVRDRDEGLCEETGGRWDPGSCGHYSCGEPPLCLAIVPGCDCGPQSRFVAGEGCLPDVGCALVCGTIRGMVCPTGATCFDVPNGCGFRCGADCAGFCAVESPARPRLACGGLLGAGCPDELECADDPLDACDPDCGDADCRGICVAPLPRDPRPDRARM